MATVEGILAQNQATLDSVNPVAEIKAAATPLLNARLGARELPVVALQPFGKGKVLGIASNTLWKWATQPEPLRSAYGLFWRQAIRNLTGKIESGHYLSVRFDKDFYRPGEPASVEIRVAGARPEPPRFNASLSLTSPLGPARGGPDQPSPVPIEPLPGQSQAWHATLRFRERGEYVFRLVAYQNDRVLEVCEKNLAVAPLLPEGARLEIDEPFLRQLAQRGGGAYFRETEANQLLQHLGGQRTRQVTVQESSLVEAGPWFLLALLAILLLEWILRRKMGLL
jgi:hypothetical protein